MIHLIYNFVNSWSDDMNFHRSLERLVGSSLAYLKVVVEVFVVAFGYTAVYEVHFVIDGGLENKNKKTIVTNRAE